MSFLGGAECSTAGNALSQFTKHVQDDKSLQRDSLVGQGPRGLQESFRSRRNGSGQDEVDTLCKPHICNSCLNIDTKHLLGDAILPATEWAATSRISATFCYGTDEKRP
jgi:hypothetical protein